MYVQYIRISFNVAEVKNDRPARRFCLPMKLSIFVIIYRFYTTQLTCLTNKHK